MEKNKPQVRFKGYDKDWIPSKLGSIVDLENGFAFKSKYFQDEISTHIVLTPGNVNIGGGFQFGKGRYYNTNGEFSHRFILKPNDIFLTMTDLTPTAQTLGFPALIPDDGNVYLHNQRLGKLINFDSDKKFLFQLLCNPKFQKQIALTSSGTTVKHTSPTKILTTKINYPYNKAEQQKIGSFFENLDKLLTRHQQKHTKLQALKKAMLAKMFPQQGQTVPEIRFKGFSGDWEEKKLSNEVDFFSGLTYSPFDVVKTDGTFVIRSSNIKNGQFVDADNVYVNTNKVNCEFVKKNDIAVVVRNGSRDLIGKHAQITSDVKNTVIGAFMTGLRSEEPYFINALLDSNQFKIEINKNLGATINQITTGNFKEMMFCFPNKDEQKIIGNYFNNIDILISNHKIQIEKLQNLKKAFLSKMFI